MWRWRRVRSTSSKPQDSNPLEIEFENIRRQGPKLSPLLVRWRNHIEMHLDNGDVVCRCDGETNLKQYGVRTHSGTVVTDNHWTNMANIMSGLHGFDWRRASEFGQLVVWEDGEWKDVDDDLEEHEP